MAVSQLGSNQPNGSVGVTGWLRNMTQDRYTAGVIEGFTPIFSGMSVQPAGGPRNSCQAVNANGDMMVMGLNQADTTTLPLSAPTTSGQAICYAIVAWCDPTVSTTANNGVGGVHIDSVAGTAATIGSETIPTDGMIRNAITNGSTDYVCVLMTITVPYGVTSLVSQFVDATVQGSVMVNGQGSMVNPFMSNPNRVFVVSESIQNTDNIWDWRKWSDGRMEQWMTFNPNTNVTMGQFGSMYHGYRSGVPNYPTPFINPPIRIVDLRSIDNWTDSVITTLQGTSQTASLNTSFGTPGVVLSASITMGHPVWSLRAIGRWA